MRLKHVTLVLTLGMIAVLAACGGSSHSTPPPPTLSSIAVTPATSSINTSGSNTSVTYKAEATYSDGSKADISSTATWSASPSGIVTLSGSTATAAAAGSVTIKATSGSVSGTAALTVVGATSISVTPATDVISTTGSSSVTYTATETNSDGTQTDVTSSATWSASPAIVTFSGSTATAAAVGAGTITATVGSVSGTAVLNVTDLNLGNSNLNGTYVFQAGGVDAVGPVYAAGTLAFDGNGNITSGVLDANSASGTVVANMSSISGTYSVTADGRGLMTLTGTGIGTSVPFALAISKDGSKGKFIEFDGKAAVAGTFEKQTAGALSGTYTFRLSGFEVSSAAANCAGKPACYMGEVGVLTVPSSGTALAGFADANLTNGNSYPTGAFGGTFNAPTSGRGTMTVNLRNGTPVSLVYYVVSPNKFFMASANTETSEIFAGQAESQGTLAAFSGDYTFLLDHAATPTTGTFEKTGRMSLASGAITQGSEAEDLSSSAVQDQSFDFSGGTYTDPTAGPQGQGTISGIVTSTGVPLNRYFVYYAVDSTKAYMLQTTANCTQAGVNTCDGGAFRAAIGEFEGGGSTLLPVSGDFIFSSNELGELVLGNCSPCGQNLQVGQLVSDGSGGFSGIVDAVKHAGAGTSAIISSIPVSSTMLGSVPTALCATSTCTFEHGWTPSNFQALAITNYLVYVRSDGNKAVLLGYQPDIDGVMDLQ